jgi:hypothetical protein
MRYVTISAYFTWFIVGKIIRLFFSLSGFVTKILSTLIVFPMHSARLIRLELMTITVFGEEMNDKHHYYAIIFLSFTSTYHPQNILLNHFTSVFFLSKGKV